MSQEVNIAALKEIAFNKLKEDFFEDKNPSSFHRERFRQLFQKEKLGQQSLHKNPLLIETTMPIQQHHFQKLKQ